MAVNPISWPQANVNSQVDQSQWATLGNLGNVYREAQEKAQRRSTLAGLTGDPATDARALMQSADLPLVQMGLGQLNKQSTDAENRRQFDLNYGLAQNTDKRAGAADARAAADERRRAADWEDDDPEVRKAKLRAVGQDPNDPNFAPYVLENQPMPSAISLEMEKRAKAAEARAVEADARTKINFEQTQKYATREQRLQAVKDGELNIDDPEIRRWVGLGGEIPDMAKNRLGLGAPTYTRDKEGVLRAYQLSASGTPVEVKVPQDQQILGPGEIAQQKAQGTAVGKATGGAQTALPDVVRHTDDLVDHIDKLLTHDSRDLALGRGSQLPDWMVTGTGIGDFRERVKQLAGDAMQQTMASLKGAGLGSVSDYEQKAMQAAFVRASTAQSPKAFVEAMNDAKRSAEKIREIARAKAKGDFSEKPTTAAPANRPPLGSILGN